MIQFFITSLPVGGQWWTSRPQMLKATEIPKTGFIQPAPSQRSIALDFPCTSASLAR
jgi:hypothetical protein